MKEQKQLKARVFCGICRQKMTDGTNATEFAQFVNVFSFQHESVPIRQSPPAGVPRVCVCVGGGGGGGSTYVADCT